MHITKQMSSRAAGLPYLLRYALVCLMLLASGCAGGHSSQGVKYSGKNTKTYTRLPMRVHEDKLMELLENISSLFGIAYQYGGTTRRGFDCSGFVNYIYQKTFNARLPRTSRDLARIGRKVPIKKLRRGDLVFFRINGSHIDHVGIYLDSDLFAHASSSRGVTMGNLNNRYYKKHFVKGVRLLEIKGSRR